MRTVEISVTKKAYLLTFGLLLVPLAYGSGAYIPGGGARSEAYIKARHWSRRKVVMVASGVTQVTSATI